MSALAESDQADEAPADTPWRDRTGPTLLGLLATGWTLFAALAATDGFAHIPALADWPALIATIAMPLTLLAVLWMAWLRSGRSEQARFARVAAALRSENRSEEHTSELQSLMRISYAVFCLKKKKQKTTTYLHNNRKSA